MSIMDKILVLKLNRSWMPVGFSTIAKAVVDLCADINCYALDIQYELVEGQPDLDKPISMNPVTWDNWIQLPVRPWDIPLHSPSITVRAPTVLIARHFDAMPIIAYGTYPTTRQIQERDEFTDQYTGRKLAPAEMSIDHVVPVSKGGKHTWDNMVLTHKDINFKKGNRLNKEVGLKLIKQPAKPRPVAISSLIREVRHADWKHFLLHKIK